MSSPEHFMGLAVDLSRRRMRAEGCAPFAAVVVKDGVVVGEGVNSVVNNHDATSHGEIEAIRDAGRNLKSWDLSGCELYTTCEPCEMCVAAMFWAKIGRMYYANTLADCERIGFDLGPLRAAVRAPVEERALPATRVLAGEAHAVLEEWASTPGFSPFQ